MTVLYAFINKELHQPLMNRFLNGFPSDFKDKILKYRKWEDAQLSLLGRVLLKCGLKKYYDLDQFEIELSQNYKPFLKEKNIYFNISHSHHLVACAIADFPIGIDTERIDRSVNYLDFQYQMTAGEKNRIHNSEDQILDFFVYWAQKEAVLKAHGSGMMIPLDSFEICDGQCTLEGKKFFVTECRIDESYQSYTASENIEMISRSVTLENIELNQLLIS